MTAHLERLDRYLHAQMARLRADVDDTEPGRAPRPQPFVTLSRQAGAGGHSLANALLDSFAGQPDRDLFGGWQVFDQRLCEIVAGDPAYSDALESLLMEEYRTPAADMVRTVLRSSLDQDFVMGKVFRTVRALASVGKAIIVGRGGAQVTADMPGGVRLRVVAPEEQRVERIMEVFHVDQRKARAKARELDANRARLIRVHFGVDIDDPTQYDAVWNTGSSSAADIGEATAAMIRVRAAALHPG